MQLLYKSLPDMKLPHLLKCSVEPILLANNIPNFYRQILHAWYELGLQPTSILEIRREILWYNKYIKIDGESFFNKNLYDNGIISINYLLFEDGFIMSCENIVSKYDVGISQLRYMSLIDAIPLQWRQCLKRSRFPKIEEHTLEDPHLNLNG